MENFLSVIILTFIVIYLVYDLVQKRNKKRHIAQQASPAAGSSPASGNQNTEMESPGKEKNTNTGQEDVESEQPDETLVDDAGRGEGNKEQERPDSPEQKIRKIEEIVQQGLYGNLDKEKCLTEIKKIIHQ